MLSTTSEEPSDRVAVTCVVSATCARRPGATCTCSPSGIVISAPLATRSSGARGRAVGGKNPSAGTVMNAYERTPSAVVFVSRYGMVCARSPSSTVTVPSAATEATSAAERGTDTSRSDSGPLGFCATASTSTSTLVRPTVSTGGTTTSRATGGSTGASGSTVTVSTAPARAPRALCAVYPIGSTPAWSPCTTMRLPTTDAVIPAGTSSSSARDSVPPETSVSFSSTRTSTRWPGRIVTVSSRATTRLESAGRSAMPTRTVATARWPVQSSTA